MTQTYNIIELKRPLCYYRKTIKHGKINGYLGIAEDISFKKILENSLLEQKNEFETMFNTSKDGIAILDLESNFIDFNDAYKDMTGYTREELLSKSCISLSVSEYKEDFSSILKYK